MQILPAGQLRRNRLLRIPQLAAHDPQLLGRLRHAVLRIELRLLTRLLEEAHGPAVRAADRAAVAVERLVRGLCGRDKCVGAREGGENGHDGGGDGEEVGVEELVRVRLRGVQRPGVFREGGDVG